MKEKKRVKREMKNKSIYKRNEIKKMISTQKRIVEKLMLTGRNRKMSEKGR